MTVARLITFSGIDCSGKSTQIQLLQDALAERGERVITRWLRPGYSRALDGVRRWVRQVRPGALPQPGDSAARRNAFARPGVARAWATMALVDGVVNYALVLRWSLLRGRTVVYDRYVEDGLLDLTLRFPRLGIESWALAALLRRAAPRPAISIFLDIPDEELASRMEKKNEPFPDDPQVRRARADAYRRLAAAGTFGEVIDGARPPDVVHRDILSRLDRAARNRR